VQLFVVIGVQRLVDPILGNSNKGNASQASHDRSEGQRLHQTEFQWTLGGSIQRRRHSDTRTDGQVQGPGLLIVCQAVNTSLNTIVVPG
jgi:hypothetical protein